MTGTTDTRIARLEIAARARQRAQLAGMTDEQLAAEAAQVSPAIQAWLATLSNNDLAEITDDTPAGRALLTTAPVGAG
jgi:hypothetical protein